jgi:hypothetical protein
MKIDTGLFVISAVATTAVLWVICSLIVLLYPEQSTYFAETMMHLAPGQIKLQMNWAGFLSGLCSWGILAAFGAWLLTFMYSILSPKKDEYDG